MHTTKQKNRLLAGYQGTIERLLEKSDAEYAYFFGSTFDCISAHMSVMFKTIIQGFGFLKYLF